MIGRRAHGLLSCSLLAAVTVAWAHDFRLGALRIDHPYALPTPAGATTGAAYLRTLRNTGDQADRLVGASTPVAQAVQIHRSVVDDHRVQRMRAVDGIDLPAKAEVALRHDGEFRLTLIGLKAPLKDGDRFPLTLRFQKAGEREVAVWVQRPRGLPATSGGPTMRPGCNGWPPSASPTPACPHAGASATARIPGSRQPEPADRSPVDTAWRRPA